MNGFERGTIFFKARSDKTRIYWVENQVEKGIRNV